MPLMIRQGDTTSHGGQVLEGFPLYMVDGRPASGLGHQVACPKCKGVYPIVQGNPAHTCNGIPLAFEGMKTACGATLIASQSRTTHNAPSSGLSQVAKPHIPHNPLRNQTEDRVVQFVIRHQLTKEPQQGVAYRIELSDGASATGVSDAQGLTAPLLVKKTIEAELKVLSQP